MARGRLSFCIPSDILDGLCLTRLVLKVGKHLADCKGGWVCALCHASTSTAWVWVVSSKVGRVQKYLSHLTNHAAYRLLCAPPDTGWGAWKGVWGLHCANQHNRDNTGGNVNTRYLQ